MTEICVSVITFLITKKNKMAAIKIEGSETRLEDFQKYFKLYCKKRNLKVTRIVESKPTKKSVKAQDKEN